MGFVEKDKTAEKATPQENIKLTKAVEDRVIANLNSKTNPHFSELSEATRTHISKKPNDFFYACISGKLPGFVKDHQNEFWPPDMRKKVSKEMLNYGKKVTLWAAAGFRAIGLGNLTKDRKDFVFRVERNLTPKEKKAYKILTDGFSDAYKKLLGKGLSREEAARKLIDSRQFLRITEVLASADPVKRATELILSLKADMGIAERRKEPKIKPGAPELTEARLNTLVQSIVLTNLAQLRQGKTSKARKDLEKLGFDAEDAKKLVELAGSAAKKSKSKSKKNVLNDIWKEGVIKKMLKKALQKAAGKKTGPMTEGLA